jgi:hypothetical protein
LVPGLLWKEEGVGVALIVFLLVFWPVFLTDENLYRFLYLPTPLIHNLLVELSSIYYIIKTTNNLRSRLSKRIERLSLKKQQAPHLEPAGTTAIFYPRFIKDPWHRTPSTLFKQPG